MNLEQIEDLSTIAFTPREKPPLQELFPQIVALLSEELEVNPVIRRTYISITEEHIPQADIFSLGVRRTINEDTKTMDLVISHSYIEFFSFILLREAYYCFLPIMLVNQRRIQVYINLIVEHRLRRHPSVEKWQGKIRKQIVDKEYKRRYGRVDKFLSSHSDKNENPIRFFIKYVRENATVLNEKRDLYTEIFAKFSFRQSRNLFNDEVVETIRIMYIIFEQVKIFNSIAEFGDLFSQLKANGTIETDLSKRKFLDNIRWLKNYSYVAPNYQMLYNQLGLEAYVLFIQFHPFVSRFPTHVNHILKNFPFLRYIRIHHSGFSYSAIGYIIMPKVYRRDLLETLKTLKQEGYTTEVKCIALKKAENNLNLNYFRAFHNLETLIKQDHRDYQKKYELSKKVVYESPDWNKNVFSPTHFDFLILDRIRYYSNSGLGFERRRKALRQIKSDYLNELLSKVAQINELKTNLMKLHNNASLKERFLTLIQSYKDKGAFFLKEFLEHILKKGRQFEHLIETHEIQSERELNKLLNASNIENFTTPSYDHPNLMEKYVKSKIMPLYFNDQKAYMEHLDVFSLYLNILNAFFELKIFAFKPIKKIIENKQHLTTIFKSKQKQLKRFHDQLKIKELSVDTVKSKLQSYLDREPPLIQPMMLTTISTVPLAKYNLVCMAKGKFGTQSKINDIKTLFPRSIICEGTDLLTNEAITFLDFFLPNPKINEKRILITNLNQIIGKKLLFLLRVNSFGIMEVFSLQDYYDHSKGGYFYTDQLFSEFMHLIRAIFPRIGGTSLSTSTVENKALHRNRPEMDLKALVSYEMSNRSRNSPEFHEQAFHRMVECNQHLGNIIKRKTKRRNVINEDFYETYIQGIKIVPQFQRFGFSKYYLWFKTPSISEIRLKTLLTNTFLDIHTLAEVNTSMNSYLLSYLFPFRSPNTSYLNWLRNTKRVFLEYFLVTPTFLTQILHFSRNIVPKGWDLKADKFLTYAQKRTIENNPTIVDRFVRQYSLNTTLDETFGPASDEFKALSEVYSDKSKNIRHYLGFDSHTHRVLTSMELLLDRRAVFPYFTLKRLNLKERIFMFLPEIDDRMYSRLVSIFSFFNYCFVYKIEGEYFIKGMNEVSSIHNGAIIELYLPECELHEFFRAFRELFSLLGLSEYAITYDLIDGSELISEAYGSLGVLDNYRPLTNLQWNEKDNKWMNIKLLNEHFEFLPIDLRGHSQLDNNKKEKRKKEKTEV